MKERIVEVKVPPAARKEMADYCVCNDPVAKKILLTESGKVENFLIMGGYIKTRDRVQIRFVPDSDTNFDNLIRTIEITGAVRDSEGRFFKVGNPEHTLKVKATFSNKN
jgi:hypothetical protein